MKVEIIYDKPTEADLNDQIVADMKKKIEGLKAHLEYLAHPADGLGVSNHYDMWVAQTNEQIAYCQRIIDSIEQIAYCQRIIDVINRG